MCFRYAPLRNRTADLRITSATQYHYAKRAWPVRAISEVGIEPTTRGIILSDIYTTVLCSTPELFRECGFRHK